MTFNPANDDFWTFCVKHVDGLQVRDDETEMANSYVLDLQDSKSGDRRKEKRTIMCKMTLVLVPAV